MHATRLASSSVHSTTSSSSSSSIPSQRGKSPIERLAKDVIVNYIFPYLFKRDAFENPDNDSYLNTENKRSLFIASRHFSALESHVLIMRPDYLGEVLVKSGIFANNKKIHPYFNSIFTKKVTYYSSVEEITPSQRAKSRKKTSTVTKEIETRFLFTALEIRNCQISIEKMQCVINAKRFPKLQSMIFDTCKFSYKLFKKLAEKRTLSHLVLRNCKSSVGKRRSGDKTQIAKYGTQIANMSFLNSLSIDGGDNFFLTAPKEWNLPSLQTLHLVAQEQLASETLLLAASIGKIQELNLATTSLSSLNGVTMCHLRRLNLNGIRQLPLEQITAFISRHSLLEEIELQQYSEGHFQVTKELMEAIVSCKSLKKLNLNGTVVCHEALEILTAAPLNYLEELKFNVNIIQLLPGKTIEDALLLIAKMVQLKDLEIVYPHGGSAHLKEQENIVGVFAVSLMRLEFFSFHNAILTPSIIKFLQRLPCLQWACFSGTPTQNAVCLLELIKEMNYNYCEYGKAFNLSSSSSQILDQWMSETKLDLTLADVQFRNELDEKNLSKALQIRPFLKILYANQVRGFTDQVIKEMAEKRLLKYVDLEGTSVTVEGVNELLRKCPHLEYFVFPYFSVDQTIACLELERMSQMASLKDLHVYCPVDRAQDASSLIVKTVSRTLSGIEELSIYRGVFSLDVVRQLCYCETLQRVYFSAGSDKNARFLFEFLFLSKQISLEIKSEKDLVLDEHDRTQIERLQDGTTLDVSLLPRSLLEILDDELIGNAIARRPNLTSLLLANATGFTDEGIDGLEQLEWVTEVDLSGTSVTSVGIQELVKKCPHLQHITLSYTKDFDVIIQSLQKTAQKLRSLHILKGYDVVEMQSRHMQQVVQSLSQLTVLGLYGLQLTQKGTIAAISQGLRLNTLFLNESVVSAAVFKELILIPDAAFSNQLGVIDTTQMKFPLADDQVVFENQGAEYMDVLTAQYREEYFPLELCASKKNFLKIMKKLLPSCHIIDGS